MSSTWYFGSLAASLKRAVSAITGHSTSGGCARCHCQLCRRSVCRSAACILATLRAKLAFGGTEGSNKRMAEADGIVDPDLDAALRRIASLAVWRGEIRPEILPGGLSNRN